MRAVAAAGSGVVIYATGQEGRGIGLLNKLRAYVLQDAGADTVDANVELGLPVDTRSYGSAAAVVRTLGIGSIRLLSNNPGKADGLRAAGMAVDEVVPLPTAAHARNATYLRTKRDRMGHRPPAGVELNGSIEDVRDVSDLLGEVRPRADRPYVVVKLAQSLDGRLATANGDSRWISGVDERRVSHALRAAVDAIAGAIAADGVLIRTLDAPRGRLTLAAAIGVSAPVAEQFRVLEALAPGRIDLGLGRAPGGDGAAAFALNPNADTAAEQFPAQVRDLLAWVAGEPLPETHPYRAVRAHPQGATVPEAWILGSSMYGAQVGAFFGLPYCFAHFFTDGRGAKEALQLYRRDFRPSRGHPKPRSGACLWVLAAESEAEAERLFVPRAIWRVLRDRGMLMALPTPEEADKVPLTEVERAKIERMREHAFIGTPRQVGARIREVSAELGADEAVLVTWSHNPEARRRSYALLAEEFGLTPRA
jgi:luciferase family oxidoreductase group 1